MKKAGIFLGIWLLLVILSQLFLQEGDFSQDGILFALPHTFIFAAIITFGPPYFLKFVKKSGLPKSNVKTNEQRKTQEEWERSFEKNFADAYPDLDEKGAAKVNGSKSWEPGTPDLEIFKKDQNEQGTISKSASYSDDLNYPHKNAGDPAQKTLEDPVENKREQTFVNKGRHSTDPDNPHDTVSENSLLSKARNIYEGLSKKDSRISEDSALKALDPSMTQGLSRAVAASLCAGLVEDESKIIPLIILAKTSTKQGHEIYALSAEFGFLVRLISTQNEGYFYGSEITSVNHGEVNVLELAAIPVCGRSFVVKTSEDLLVSPNQPWQFFKSMSLREVLDVIAKRKIIGINQYQTVLGTVHNFIDAALLPRGGFDHSLELCLVTGLFCNASKTSDGSSITQISFNYNNTYYQDFTVSDPNFSGRNTSFENALILAALQRDPDDKGRYLKSIPAVFELTAEDLKFLKETFS